MARGFDYSRYYIKRIHPSSGLRVAMYKDDPGVYIDMKGNTVDEDVAEQCGFDIVEGKKGRLRNELLAEKQKEVDAQMRELDAEIEAKVEAAGAAPAKEVDQPKEPSPFEAPASLEIVESNAQGEPRETNRRKMTGGQAGRWKVIDKESGKTVHEDKYVNTETAESLLLEQAS